MIVKKINGQPDIPEGLEYSSYFLNQDGETYTVLPTESQKQAEIQSLKASSQLVVAERILKGTLPTDRIQDFALAFDSPKINRTYEKEWILRDPKTNELFEVIKPTHTWLGVNTMDEMKGEFKSHK